MHNLECSFLQGSVCELHSVRKKAAIHELIEKAAVFHVIDDTDRLAYEVLLRERKQTTGFGYGVAVAHAQYEGIDSVIMALGTSKRGIDYKAMDNKPVNLLFLIASPPDLQESYLQALSVLVKLVRREAFRTALLAARNVEEIEKILHVEFCCLLQREQASIH